MSAKDEQVGGDHYRKMKIQPAEFIHVNGIGYMAGCAIKYLSRYESKGGAEDLKKAIHYIRLLGEAEYPGFGAVNPAAPKIQWSTDGDEVIVDLTESMRGLYGTCPVCKVRQGVKCHAPTPHVERVLNAPDAVHCVIEKVWKPARGGRK